MSHIGCMVLVLKWQSYDSMFKPEKVVLLDIVLYFSKDINGQLNQEKSQDINTEGLFYLFIIFLLFLGFLRGEEGG